MSSRRNATRRPAGATGTPAPWRKVAVPALLAVAISVVVSVVAVSAWFVFFRSNEPDGPPTAAIVDQLSLTFPNPSFREEATSTLEQAGYVVDYYPGEEVTVGFYRSLPDQDYDLIIFRAHAARIQGVFRGEPLDETVLFTNEPYDPEGYYAEQVEARLDIAYTSVGAPKYFGITADFIEFSMQGDFDDAMVIMMGCEGLASDRTAEAFVNKGAAGYISWTDTVTATHTDAATERLLELLLLDDLSADDAVAQTMTDIGPDPIYGSDLRAYPPEVVARGE